MIERPFSEAGRRSRGAWTWLFFLALAAFLLGAFWVVDIQFTAPAPATATFSFPPDVMRPSLRKSQSSTEDCKFSDSPPGVTCGGVFYPDNPVVAMVEPHADAPVVGTVDPPPPPEVRMIREFAPRLEQGSFIYNRVTRMWRDRPETVVLKLSLAGMETPNLSDALEGLPVMRSTPVTPEMSVELRGSAGLAVEPDGPVRQPISDLSETVWQWTVTPRRASKREFLRLSVFIHLDEGVPYTARTFDDQIVVSVTTLQKAKDVVAEISPVWAFAVGTAPVLWLAYGWVRDRKWRPPLPNLPPQTDAQPPARRAKPRPARGKPTV